MTYEESSEYLTTEMRNMLGGTFSEGEDYAMESVVRTVITKTLFYIDETEIPSEIIQFLVEPCLETYNTKAHIGLRSESTEGHTVYIKDSLSSFENIKPFLDMWLRKNKEEPVKPSDKRLRSF